MGESAEEQDRGRGILSKADRDFLQGGKSDLSDQGKRDARYRIRTRTKNAIFDFKLLNNWLEYRDTELVFDDLERADYIPLFKFLFKGILTQNDGLASAREEFEKTLEIAIAEVYGRVDTDHIINDVDVEISIGRMQPDIEEIESKYRAGEETPEELNFLMNSEEFDGDTQLIIGRWMKHAYQEGDLPEAVRSTVIEQEEGISNMEEYFEEIDRKIAEEGRKSEE